MNESVAPTVSTVSTTNPPVVSKEQVSTLQNRFLEVSIKTKEKIVFEGKAATVTSTNVQGVFDVLPGHANFISLIHDFLTIDSGLATEAKFELEKGVMYVLSDKLDVYIGI